MSTPAVLFKDMSGTLERMAFEEKDVSMFFHISNSQLFKDYTSSLKFRYSEDLSSLLSTYDDLPKEFFVLALKTNITNLIDSVEDISLTGNRTLPLTLICDINFAMKHGDVTQLWAVSKDDLPHSITEIPFGYLPDNSNYPTTFIKDKLVEISTELSILGKEIEKLSNVIGDE